MNERMSNPAFAAWSQKVMSIAWSLKKLTKRDEDGHYMHECLLAIQVALRPTGASWACLSPLNSTQPDNALSLG